MRFPPHRLRRFVFTLTAAASLLLPDTADAQRSTRCDRNQRVRSVRFDGSPAFDEVTLAASIVTHEAGLKTRLFRIGDAPCLDSLELRRDALRLAVLHRQAGWFAASVSPVVARSAKGVRLLFAITPGREAILDSVLITGLPDTPDGRRPFDAPLRTLENRRFDRTRVDTTVDAVLARLRDAGYARATRPVSTVTIDTAQALVQLTMDFDVKRPLTIGEVQIDVQPLRAGDQRVDSADVKRLVAVRAGQPFSASRILESQRDLYRSEAFRLVLVDTITPEGSARDSVINLRISVAEARSRNARVGVGWATQDCIRAEGRITDRGFLGVGRRLEFSARASKIGLGDPVDFAPALCSNVIRADPFSERLNYYVGATVTNARLFGWPVIPVFTVYSERRGEPFAFLRETSIGTLFEASRQFTPRLSGVAGVQYENGRTITDPVVSCSRFGQCRPEDFVQTLFGRGVAIANTGVAYDRTNDVVNPSGGWRVRSEVRAGQTFSELVRSLRFYRTTGEGSTYFRFLGGIIGTRVQISRAFAPGADLVDGSPLIPPQERLFAGGQNSVRGFQQNLLGPLVYVVSDVTRTIAPDGTLSVVVNDGATFVRAVPRGGTGLLVGNVEWRRNLGLLGEELQFAAFVDAGNVWESGAEGFRWGDVRATPGVGLRIATPLGPFRVDIGYQPYQPPLGRALFFSTADDAANGGQILCASPRAVGAGGSGTDIFNCPNSFRPPSGRGVLSRLAFHFGLGQAF